jgi:hypothetical protein
LARRDARAVEEDSLENYCAGNGTVGSNPTLSAIKILNMLSIFNLESFGKNQGADLLGASGF